MRHTVRDSSATDVVVGSGVCVTAPSVFRVLVWSAPTLTGCHVAAGRSWVFGLVIRPTVALAVTRSATKRPPGGSSDGDRREFPRRDAFVARSESTEWARTAPLSLSVELRRDVLEHGLGPRDQQPDGHERRHAGKDRGGPQRVSISMALAGQARRS